MKYNFEELIMTKNQFGEYSPLRTLIGGGCLLGQFNKLLREEDIFDKNSNISRIVVNMVSMLSDKEVAYLKKCFKSNEALLKWSHKGSGTNVNSTVMCMLLGELYRNSKLMLTANGIEIPTTVELGSKEQVALAIILDAEEIEKFKDKRLMLSEDLKKAIVFGEYKDKALLGNVRQDIMNAFMRLFQCAKDIVLEPVTARLHDVEKELSKKETAINNLKRKQERLSKQLQIAKELKEVPKVTVKEVDIYKPLYDDAMSDNFELEKKVFNLQERLKDIESTIIDKVELERSIELVKEERQEKSKEYDLNKYNIVILADRKRYKSDMYKIVDLIASPKSVTALDGADIVVMLTGFINHSAYYSGKNYCKAHGIKSIHCAIRTNNLEKIDDAIRQSVIECLI